MPSNTQIVTNTNETAQNLTLTLQILDINTNQKTTKIIDFELI
jgi:hypothetical protein